MRASPYLFCLTQVGAEKILKNEVSMRAPDLRSSFSRPGFVTFKDATSGAGFSASRLPHFAFARVTALSIGKAQFSDLSPLVPLVQNVMRSAEGSVLSAHVFARDTIGPEDDPKKDVSAPWVEKWQKALRDIPGLSSLRWNHEVPIGGTILHFAVIDENEVWLGVSVRRAFEWGVPAGKPHLVLPEPSPSRAYLKIEEALILSGVELKDSDRAIEVGSAPGGACYSLLSRGLHVTGIDRGEMDPGVVSHPRFQWEKFSIGEYMLGLESSDKQPEAEWLLVDMNTDPRVAAKETLTLALSLLPNLLGVFFTMKVNHEGVAEDISVIAENFSAKMEFKLTRLIQLPSNKSEVCFMGFTREGVQRLPKRVGR